MTEPESITVEVHDNHFDKSANIKMFAFASQSVSGEDMATIFLNAIVPMQEFVRKHPAPFIAKIYRDGRLDMWKDHKILMEEFEQ